MKDKNIDIKNRIANAKTTDELLALAAEIGEPLTLEQAEKLLAEIKVESQTAAQSFASKEDIPDAKLAAVAGGFDNSSGGSNTHFSQFTYRNGNVVLINFNMSSARCQHWACNKDRSSNYYLEHITEMSDLLGTVESDEARCSACNQTASCGACAYRSAQGWFYHDFCNNPEVRRYHGL